MATSAYYSWDDAGRPFRLATPIAELESWAHANGIAVLGTIGNEEHLTARVPQDHTPFSATAWPVPLPGYIVTAIDLANVRGLGQAIEDDARLGILPWLKYMNHSGQHLDSRDLDGDGVTWEEYPSSDEHVHLSIRTDWIDRSIGVFDPFGLGGGFTMFCKFGDKNDAVKSLQLRLLELDPNALPQFGADRDYGQETADALSRLVSGGPGEVYGPEEELLTDQLLSAKRGAKGEKGDKGDPGEPGKTPTHISISGEVVAYE